MRRARVHQQFHGYRRGHQLLSSSLTLPPKDQDTVDRLSDIAGPVRPGEVFEPYLTTYPLPSGTHYVVGRTFQDLKAARSGCVVTRSLLISVTDLADLESFEGMLSMLVAAPDREERAEECEVSLSGASPASVNDPRVVELTEALFFEERRPIVYFDAVEAEAIASRLILALWPGFRRKFSICTYSLSPRRIGDTYFDLVFAPVTARSRFVDLPCRRIGMSVAGSKEPNHRWSRPTAFHIFRADIPSLVAKDALGVLAYDKDGDQTDIRLMLLWNELANRVTDSPTAVLGMLDILNARDTDDRDVWSRLLPTVIRAIDLVTQQSSTGDAWKFLFSLEVKVDPRRRSVGALMHHVEGAACRLARLDLSETLKQLAAEAQEKPDLPLHGLQGLAEGAAGSEVFQDSVKWFEKIPAHVLWRMLDGSDAFLRRTLEVLKDAPKRWLPVVTRVLEEPELGPLRRVRLKLVRLGDEGVIEKLLPVMLDDVSRRDLLDLVVEVGTRDGFASGSLSEVMVRAAKASESVAAVRDAVARRFSGKGADRLLLATLVFTKSDVQWLLDDLEDSKRAARLLIELLEGASNSRIREVSTAKEVMSGVIKLLTRAPESGSRQVARLLLLEVADAKAAIDCGFGVLAHLPRRERDQLGVWMLGEALRGAATTDQRMTTLLTRFGKKMLPGELITCAVGKDATSETVGRNIGMLNTAAPSLRDVVVSQIDRLSAQLVERGREDLGEAAYLAWATMLRDSKKVSGQVRLRAARTVLLWALRMSRCPVSSLILESFPVVYSESPTQKTSGNDARRSEWDMFMSHNWLGKKRSKSGRHNLLSRLVEAFMKSTWPAADLLLVATQADVGEKIVKLIRRKSSGDRYLASIRRDIGRLDEKTREQILKHVPDL